jgi:K+-sensing histidine kinase KdpD
MDNQIPETLPAIRVDLPKFTRLFELLFKDELAMLPAGSRIHLTAEEAMRNGRSEIAIHLTDNGPALPQDALRVVLDPFTGGAPSEYGINLMACFFIAHHHGGTIEARNLPDKGNTFIVRLPLQPEPAVTSSDDTQFLKKALLNQQLWDKLISQG